MESKYRVVLLDKDGFDIGGDYPADNLKEAKDRMAYLLSEQYARQGAESTHKAMGTHKAEVRNSQGECVLDAFYEAPPRFEVRQAESTGVVVIDNDTDQEVLTFREDDVYPYGPDTAQANAEFSAAMLNYEAGPIPKPGRRCTPGPWQLAAEGEGGFSLAASSPEGAETLAYLSVQALGAQVIAGMNEHCRLRAQEKLRRSSPGLGM